VKWICTIVGGVSSALDRCFFAIIFTLVTDDEAACPASSPATAWSHCSGVPSEYSVLRCFHSFHLQFIYDPEPSVSVSQLVDGKMLKIEQVQHRNTQMSLLFRGILWPDQ
jgi:hypothetical protein